MLNIPLSITDDPKLARAYGWTKRHQHVQFHYAGKWRTAGFFTLVQQRNGKHFDAVIRKVHTNSEYKGTIAFI